MKYGWTKGVISNSNNRNGGDLRRPLRTVQELAEEFGITPGQLGAYLSHHDGPKPQMKQVGIYTRKATWYDPVVMRKWWKELQAKKQGT